VRKELRSYDAFWCLEPLIKKTNIQGAVSTPYYFPPEVITICLTSQTPPSQLLRRFHETSADSLMDSWLAQSPLPESCKNYELLLQESFWFNWIIQIIFPLLSFCFLVFTLFLSLRHKFIDMKMLLRREEGRRKKRHTVTLCTRCKGDDEGEGPPLKTPIMWLVNS
jgi:hypothetical protein